MNGRKWRETLRKPRGIAIAAGAAVVLVMIFGLIRSPAADRGGREPDPTFVVQQGPLTIGILQSGTIRAVEQVVITSEVEGQTTLIYLIEEGTLVEEGDLLAELDASGLQDGLAEQQIRTQNAEASFIQARENLAVTRNQGESDISLAELEYRFAVEDLNQYREGRYRQELMEAESKITLAEEELQLAARKLEWSEKLFAENYVSQADRDADALAHNRAKLNLELAKAARQLLEEFTYTRQIAQLESDVDQKERALDRVRLKASADIVQAEANLRAKEADWIQQQAREEKIRDQIAKTRITAPRAGQVVYATSAQTGWRGTAEPLEAGQQVRERQELIHLPTADRMMAVVQVHESNLDKVRVGLPVIVTADALQGRSFAGRVSRIAPLPDATSMWMNPDLKVYRTEVRIEGTQPALRTGMSCMAEIIVDKYDDAVYVPVQAVIRVEGKPTVYVRQGREFLPRTVEVGLDNNRMIHVLAGLSPGQTVLLTPPLHEGAAAEDRALTADVMTPDDMRTMIRQANDRSAAERSPRRGAGGEAPSGAEGGEERLPMTAEQREEMRRRFEAMTPEQRREAGQRRGGGPGRREGGRAPGDAP